MATQEKGTPQGRGQMQGNGMQGGTAQDVENIVRRLFVANNEHDARKMLPFLATTIQGHDVPANKTFQGHGGFTEWMNNWITAFPDYKLEINNILATPEKCVVEFTARATHTGNLLSPVGNVPPTNRRIEMKFVESYELANGLITRSRTYYDAASMLNQLGLMQKTMH